MAASLVYDSETDVSVPSSPASTGSPLKKRLAKLGQGPLSFWFLNHQLEKPELARQLRELKEKGFSGVFFHPRGGLLEPYGSCHWYDAIGFCINEARQLGLEAWLYDEDPYPSGAAGGRVIFENPDLCASSLEHRTMEVSQAGRYSLDLPAGALVGAYVVRGDSIHRIDHCVGIVRTDWSQYYTSNSYHPQYLEDGISHWRAETGKPHYRIMVDIEDVSRPTYLIGFVRHYLAQNPWGAYPDLLNPRSVEAFITYTHDEYAKRFGESFGNTVPGIFTDEPKLRGPLPWSQNVAPLFSKVSGLDLMEVLPHLALSLSPETPYIRWAYRETLAKGFLENFVRPLQESCASHGLFFTGHISPEEAPLYQALIAPGLLRASAMMDIPGTDFIAHTLGSAQHPLYHISPKLASSIAHAASKPLVACEALAVADWTQDFAFLAKVTNWLFALGVNRIITHGQFYSIDGLRKREAPPSQFFQASYWEHFEAYSAFVALLTKQLTQGQHEARVLVYYPEESFMALSFQKDGEFSPDGEKMQKEFGDLLHSLLVKGFDFDLADASILSKAVPKDQGIAIAEETFQAIIVPGLHLCEASWEILQIFQRHGVPIYFLESEISLLVSPRQKIEVQGDRVEVLASKLDQHITPIWRCEEGELIGHKRSTPSGPILFLCNNGDQEFDGLVELDFPGPYEICLPARSPVWAHVGECLHLDLSPGQGVLIRPAQDASSGPYIAHRRWRSLPVEWVNWTARPVSENCLVLHQFRILSQSNPQEVSVLPSIDCFAYAPVVDLLSPTSLTFQPPDPRCHRFFRTDFNWRGSSTRLRLVHDTDLSLQPSTAQESPIEFLLNEEPIGPSARNHTYDPMNRETDITSLVRPGRNSLTMIQKGGSVPHLPWPYDAVRIFGAFHVDFPYGNFPPATLSRRRENYACASPVSPTLLGHPHYHGIFCYDASFYLSAVPTRAALRFDKVYETMQVSINGHNCGYLWTPPYLLEIDPLRLVQGVNKLTLHCSTSPANYLQVMNRPAGPEGPIEWCEA